MGATTADELELTPEERGRYDEDGFLVRHDVLDRVALAQLTTAAERLEHQLIASRQGDRQRTGSYVVERAQGHEVNLKWEGDSDVLLGIEPVAHLDSMVAALAAAPGLVEPVKGLIGTNEVSLYTEKLNYKRARVGGRIVLHQDYPYWRAACDDIDRVVTALVALDDSTQENGCLEVLPGSHRLGPVPGRDVEDASLRNEIDDAVFDTSGMIPVEIPAGAAIFFGPLLVHRSAANTSEHDRRTMLYTYQPAGNRHRHRPIVPPALVGDASV